MAHIEDRWFNVFKEKDESTGRTKTTTVKTERHGVGMRYRVRYIDPNGQERKKSFPDRAKKAAEDFMVSVEADKLRGAYINPAAGRITFREYAETWLSTRAFDESSREVTEHRVRKHLYPFFGSRQLASIKPGHIREWDSRMVGVIAAATRSVTFTNLRTILGAAVDDERIAKNPCSAKSVTAPKQPERKVVPWTFEQVEKIKAGMPMRYKALVSLGAGCGMRQGEIFGLAEDDIDLNGGWIHVRRQVKRVRSRLVFGLPKTDKDRRVPLPSSVGAFLREHMKEVSPVEVTLPWEDPAGADRTTARLLFTTTRRCAINRGWFNSHVWHLALAAAGIPQSRAAGMHALRHFYASTLLDAGESIKALATYLGHSDPGFTLRIYTHLMPASEERTRKAIDSLFEDANTEQTPQ